MNLLLSPLLLTLKNLVQNFQFPKRIILILYNANILHTFYSAQLILTSIV